MAKHLLITGCAVFIVVMLLMYLLQRHLIYIPIRKAPRLNDYHTHGMHKIWLQTQDGLVLQAWYRRANDKQATMLYLHGNAGHIGYRMPIARQFMSEGLGVLLLEYRGYGGNEGHPTENGLYEDGRAAMRFLQRQGISPRHLVLYGESLGTGVATQLALEYPVCGVVLQSPFTSLDALARYHYPWIFIKPWDHFDSLHKINEIKAPLLILHGKEDKLVPYQQAVILFERAKEPKKMLYFEKGSHDNLWEQKNFAKEVINFVSVHCS